MFIGLGLSLSNVAAIGGGGAVVVGFLLFSGDAQSGADKFLLSGDAQSGTDKLLYREAA
jgi:hypothetical protein